MSNTTTTTTKKWEPSLPPSFPSTSTTSSLMLRTRDSTQDQILMETFYILSVLENLPSVNSIPIPDSKPHFSRYRSWLNSESLLWSSSDPSFSSQHFPVEAEKLVSLSSPERQSLLEKIHREHCCGGGEETEKSHMYPVIEAAWRVHVHMVDILSGKEKLLKVLMRDNLLPQFYDWTNELSDLSLLWKGFAKAGRGRGREEGKGLRVLEIGAGTGGTTERVLRGFRDAAAEEEEGEEEEGGRRRLYQEYMFTDVSATFFDAARERFREYEGVEYKALDISKDPCEGGQGFEKGGYDLIVASNVLHATPYLVETLKNCRSLLKSDGFLFLQEMSPPGKYPDFVVGMFPGWWAGDPDGRPNGPTIKPDEWDRRLREAGFEGLHAVAYDNEPPLYYNANMLARAAE